MPTVLGDDARTGSPQQRLTKTVIFLLGAEEIKKLHERSAVSAAISLCHLWPSIAATFALGAAALSLAVEYAVPALAGLAAFQSTRINALNVLVHEGSHRALARSRRVNSLLSNWCAGYAIGFDEDSYRSLHLQHHRHLNAMADPDRPLYELPRSRPALLWALLSDLFLVSFVKRALVYARRARGNSGAARTRMLGHAVGKALANIFLLTLSCLWAGVEHGLILYGILWLLPLLGLYPIIIRVRVITEHFAPDVFDGTKRVFVARTSVCGPLEHYLLGAQMDYHFEHHLFPGIPYANLKRLHRRLVQRGFFDGGFDVVVEHSLSGGYLSFCRRLLADERHFTRSAAPMEA